MLSHCVPNARGCAARARAWELLRLASQTHRVHLAAVVDGPVDLAQWRTLDECTAHLSLQSPDAFGSLLDYAHRRIGSPAALAMRSPATVMPSVHGWLESTAFDVVICTHPRMLGCVRHIAARLVVCDMRSSLDAFMHVAGGGMQASAHRTVDRFRLRLSRMLEAGNAPVTMIVSPNGLAEQLMRDVAPTLPVPEGIDLAYYVHDALGGATLAEGDGTPRVLLHMDGRDRAERRRSDWFVRDVWPQIARAVPNAQLDCTDADERDPLAALRQASVVVTPQPTAARFPILQAMAMQRPIVAAAPAAAHVAGARHGEHLLLSGDAREWIRHCQDALQSAAVRIELARKARSFVEEHGLITQTGRPLLQALQPPTPIVATPLRQAA